MFRNSRTWTILAFIAACVAIAIWSAARGPVTDLSAAWPPSAEIDTLGAYAEAATPLPVVDDYSAHLPALEPEPDYSRDYEDVPAEIPIDPASTWRVSAILISGGRPVAIVNDQQVRPGERLADGAVVEGIESTRVTILDSRGRRHSLGISPGE